MVKRLPTLHDVARAAGVSTSTASRVLNGTGRASSQTRARVLETAERLNFRPDALARFFATGKSSTIGLLSRTEPGSFTMPVLIGAQHALGSHDLAALMYYSNRQTARFEEDLHKLQARRVDGVIFFGNSPDETYPSISSAIPAPVVYVFARSDDVRDISLVPDGLMAGRLAGEHLVGLGRRHIAHITAGAHVRAVIERAAGLCSVLESAGLALALGRPLYGNWLHHWGFTATQEILASGSPIDAIFCANDQIALGAHRALQTAGVHVPDDIAIIGYDHWSRLHGAPDPFLTTIDPNLSDLGSEAVDYLIGAIDGEPSGGLHTHPCILVPGYSTLGPRSGERPDPTPVVPEDVS